MKKHVALEVIRTALASYIENCSGEKTPETREIEKAWKVINKDDHYFQVRTKGDGEMEYFIMQPEDDEFNYDPKDEKSAKKYANKIRGWVVRISEEKI